MPINPLAPVSPLQPVAPPRAVGGQPVALTSETLLAVAQAAAAEVTDQLGRIAAQSSAALGGSSSSIAGVQTPAAAAAAAAVAASEPGPAHASLQTSAVGAAAAQAVRLQGGLAPLMADLAVARQAPNLPRAMQAAIDQVLDLRTPLDGAVTGADVKRALDRSGLFLEARLAAGVASADRPGSGRGRVAGDGQPASGDRSAAPPPADLKAALLVFRQVAKTWLDATPAPAEPAAASPSPASADTSSADFAPTGPAPSPAAAMPLARPSTPPQPPALVAEPAAPGVAPDARLDPGSGVASPMAFMAPMTPMTPMTPLAPTGMTGMTATANAETPPPSPGLAQQALAQAQAPPPAGRPGPPALEAPETSAATPTPKAAQTPPAPQAQPGAATAQPVPPAAAAAIVEPDTGAAPWPLDARPAPPAAPPAGETSSAATPPPPYRDGPTSAQPAVAARLAPGAGPHALVQQLLRETGAALARQELLQIASLPDPAPPAGRPVDDSGARWMFDVPFMTPQGAAVAQFEISRDGGGGGQADLRPPAPVWRARFSLDVEPMGPVHVQIALSGERARVSLWAERPASMARLMAREPMLSTALRDADLTPELAFHAGAPQRAPVAPGKFVDQAS